MESNPINYIWKEEEELGKIMRQKPAMIESLKPADEEPLEIPKSGKLIDDAIFGWDLIEHAFMFLYRRLFTTMSSKSIIGLLEMFKIL